MIDQATYRRIYSTAYQAGYEEAAKEYVEARRQVYEDGRREGMEAAGLERARSELLDIVACAYQGMWTQPLIARVTEILAAARREGAEAEALKWRAERHTWEKAELEAFVSGRKAGKHEAALEDKYGSFDAKVQAQIADAERRGAEEMRERAAQAARDACLVPPDGGSPTEEERLVCEEAVRRIRALPLTPEEPAA